MVPCGMDRHKARPHDPAMLDPLLLKTFLEVVTAGNFTQAGKRLSLGQSTVSQHIRKLEESAGRRLLVRDTHSVVLTPDGQAMVGFAKTILDAGERAERYFAGSTLRGRLRFGAGEDFAQTRLPDILRDFTARHKLVDLELTVGLSDDLYDKIDAGALDLVFAKRRPGEDRGALVWADRLVWIGPPNTVLDPAAPIPLVLYPPPGLSRAMALEALEQAGRSWRIACTSGSLAGLRAAVLAGMGIAAHAQRLIPAGLAELPASAPLPPIGAFEFAVVGARHEGPAAELARVIVDMGERLRAAAA
jgi:DNA-binding transcriptional LysR family regulator